MHPTEIQLLEEGPVVVKTEPPDNYNEQSLSSTPSAFTNCNKHSLNYSSRPLQRIAPRPRIDRDAILPKILPKHISAQGATIKMAVTKIKEDPDRYTVPESK